MSGKSAVRVSNYYLAWGLVLVTMFLLRNLVRSRVGRALRAIHGAEEAATASGVDTQDVKLKMFVLSAVLAALGGVFLTHYNGGIGPSEASIMKSVRMVAIVAIGGMANLWGALVMGVLLNFLSLRGSFGSYDDAVFGGILLVIMLFAPQGLLRPDGAAAGAAPRCPGARKDSRREPARRRWAQQELRRAARRRRRGLRA